jgi:hypothetical protein
MGVTVCFSDLRYGVAKHRVNPMNDCPQQWALQVARAVLLTAFDGWSFQGQLNTR